MCGRLCGSPFVAYPNLAELAGRGHITSLTLPVCPADYDFCQRLSSSSTRRCTFGGVSVQFSSVLWPIWSSGGHEGRFSRDPLPVFFCRRPLWAVLAWAGVSTLWHCPSRIFSANDGVVHRWGFCSLYFLACQLRVTVGDSYFCFSSLVCQTLLIPCLFIQSQTRE